MTKANVTDAVVHTDAEFLHNLAERMYNCLTPAMGFDQGDTDMVSEIARVTAQQAAEIAALQAENEKLRAEVARLRDWEGAAKVLAKLEADYRKNHDLLGRGNMKTGRSWDLMRRQGDIIREKDALSNGES